MIQLLGFFDDEFLQDELVGMLRERCPDVDVTFYRCENFCCFESALNNANLVVTEWNSSKGLNIPSGELRLLKQAGIPVIALVRDAEYQSAAASSTAVSEVIHSKNIHRIATVLRNLRSPDTLSWPKRKTPVQSRKQWTIPPKSDREMHAPASGQKGVETLYRRLWDMESDALFLIAREDGAILEVNPAAERLYGYSRDELVTMHNIDVSAEPEKTRSATLEQTVNVPVRWHRKKDGSVFPVEIHSSHFEWCGRAVHLAAIRDITERIEHLTQLREATQRYRMLFEKAPDGILMLDEETLNILEFNDTACTQLGYERAEFSSLRLSDVHLESALPLNVVCAAAMNEGETKFEAVFRCKDGRLKDMQVMVTLVEMGGKKVFHTVMRDITSRKLVEDNLRTLSRAVKYSSAVIFITNADGVIEYVNPRFTAVTGYTATEAIGRTPTILKSDVTPPRLYEELWSTIAGGRDWQGELCNTRKNGELYWALASISPVRDDIGRIQHYVAVQEDITATKRSQEELLAAKEQAERSDMLKDAFIANMSHEIRTPLNVILGFTGLLKDMDDGGEQIDTAMCIENIERGGFRLLRTVDEILNMSSIQAGTFRNEPTILRVDDIVERMLQDFATVASEKHLALEYIADYPDAIVFADQYIFEQALSNLLDNAVKFTETGWVRVRTGRDEENLLVSVIDTGVGIDEAYIPHLFDSFSQERSGISRPFEGLGLGLALTRRYVELCSGSIHVESYKGKGTTFTMRFPLIDE